jgi:diadenosine tetraphosphate (Ap4A) HIT family hydrolase
MKKLFIIFIAITISQFSHLICMEPSFAEASAGRQALIYAPWRESYSNQTSKIQEQPEQTIQKPCIFCRIMSDTNDTPNLVLHCGKYSLIMLASQPYIDNGMHFLIIPYEHKKELCDLSPETYYEENMFTQQLCALFSPHANETYINSNQGSAAGASIPEHHHKHVMINYAPVYYNLKTAVHSTKKYLDLPALYEQLLPQVSNLENVTVPLRQLFNCKKDCYYCSILQQDAQENFIIHRGTYATVMLSHHPTYFGEIDIIPNEHVEAVETMSVELYEEINKLTKEIYPIMLKIINAQDSNIGLISYGNRATRKGHIRQKLIPRKDTWKKTPITQSNHISGDIKKFYKKILSEWHSIQYKNYYRQAAKL